MTRFGRALAIPVAIGAVACGPEVIEVRDLAHASLSTHEVHVVRGELRFAAPRCPDTGMCRVPVQLVGSGLSVELIDDGGRPLTCLADGMRPQCELDDGRVLPLGATARVTGTMLPSPRIVAGRPALVLRAEQLALEQP